MSLPEQISSDKSSHKKVRDGFRVKGTSGGCVAQHPAQGMSPNNSKSSHPKMWMQSRVMFGYVVCADDKCTAMV